MISFFRRMLSSKLVLGLFALILIAFLITGVNTKLGGVGGGGGGGASPTTVATVGRRALDADDVAQRIQLQVESLRQQDPNMDQASFVAKGGVEKTIGELIDSTAIELFGDKAGFVADQRLVEGEIASAPAFLGADGKFDLKAYTAFLRSRRITDAAVHADMRGDLIRKQVLAPVSGAARMPAGVATAYAALLVEGRTGTIGLVPTGAIPAGPPPSDAEVKAYYTANVARYTLPERRSIHYAVFGIDQLGAAGVPTDADIKSVYDANQTKYATRDVRTLTQVVFTGADAEAKANALAAKVKAGASFAAAAGGDAIAVGEKTRAEFADFGSPAAADAAFAISVGGTSAPAKSAFGWHVVHVDAARTIAGKTLAQAHDEIAKELAAPKQQQALGTLANTIQDALADGATFDDVVKKNNLTAVTTPLLLPSGQAPAQPSYTAPPEVAPLLKAAFLAEVNDPPSVETVEAGKRYAVLAVTDVAASAPRPFAEIAATVRTDLAASRAAAKARAIAEAILAKVNAGIALKQAFSTAGVQLPPVQQAGGRRIELMRAGAKAPPPVRLLFTMVPGKTKLLPAPGNGGWYVVRLDGVQAADPAKQPGLVAATQAQFTPVVGEEYVQEFANAARAIFKPRQNDRAIAELKARLTGAAPPPQ